MILRNLNLIVSLPGIFNARGIVDVGLSNNRNGLRCVNELTFRYRE